jgi:hypothetical protein
MQGMNANYKDRDINMPQTLFQNKTKEKRLVSGSDNN